MFLDPKQREGWMDVCPSEPEERERDTIPSPPLFSEPAIDTEVDLRPPPVPKFEV